VDFNEILVQEVLAEVLADARLQAEDGVVGRCAQIDPSVVQAQINTITWTLIISI